MTPGVDALLALLPGCARLDAGALAALAAGCRLEEFAPGSFLVREGEAAPDWYAVIESGGVQIARLGPEADEVLEYLAAGDVLDPGEPGCPADWSATVAERARCLLVPKAVLAETQARAQTESLGGGRGDLALFVGRIRALIKGPPLCCPPTMLVAEAARLMSERRVGSIIVIDGDGRPVGIVTDRDLRTRVVAARRSPEMAVGAIMSSPVACIDVDRTPFDGLLEMTQRNIHHLGVEEGGRLVGVVSGHDLMWLQGAHPVALAREIEAQESIESLVAVAPRTQAVVRWLAGGGAGVFDIGRIVAELNDRLVRRAIPLIEDALERAGHGRPPVAYSWVVTGSEGRREQTLKTDQDNGIVYEDPPEDLRDAAAAYFKRLGAEASATLIRLGFPRCDGDFMASNQKWSQPLSVWKGYFGSWMETQHPQHLLQACIFFDLRPVAGDLSPGRRLWEWVCAESPTRRLFLRYMARVATDRPPPLGLFGGFVLERSGEHKDTVDLKARGVFPMTQALRVYALSLGLPETNTVDRLRGAAARDVFRPAEARELEDAFELICRLRLLRQLACLEAGVPPDNFVNPETLAKGDRLLLKEAFKTLAWLQRGLEERFLTASLV